MITVELKNVRIDGALAARAATKGVRAALITHLRARAAKAKHRPGFPRSGFWAEAAETVRELSNGQSVTLEITKPGAALHYYGGTVRPKKKALAIPMNPAVADIWPSEATGTGAKLVLDWKKGKSTGVLRNAETGEIMYLLVRQATIPADDSVLPDENALADAAESAILAAKEVFG